MSLSKANAQNKYNEYKLFYDSCFDKINRAAFCVNSNPCSMLIDELNSLKTVAVNPLYNLNWDDSVKDKFIEKMKLCESNIDSVISSIENDFTNSEKLYKDALELIKQLQGQLQTLNIAIISDPFPSYLRYEKNTPEYVSAKSSYDLKYSNWQKEIGTDVLACSTTVESIKNDLNNLNQINGISLSSKVSSIQSFSFDTSHVEINDEYYYYQGGGNWGSMRFGDGTMKNSGCGLAAASACISLVTGRKETPDIVLKKLNSVNFRTTGSSVDRPAMMQKMGELYNVKVTPVSKDDSSSMDSALSSIANHEAVAVARINKNTSGPITTRNGHYVTIVDYNPANNKILVWNGGSKSNTEQWIDYSSLEPTLRADSTLTLFSA